MSGRGSGGNAVTMPEGLVALVSNLIDYAGLFPPAGLDMTTTVANYAAYLAGDENWMLERLVLPVARFDEFEAATPRLPRDDDAEPWPITAITVPAADPRLEEDLARIDAFNVTHATGEAGLAVVDAIELRSGASDDIERALDLVPDSIFPFFELPRAADPRGLLAAIVGGEAGAKIRTGGVTADLYPDVDTVARFIACCAAADVAFKATAGLHHPLRHRSETTGAMEFGFLNVFVAAALALNRELDASTMTAVLEASDIDAFTFDDDGLAFEDHRLSVEEIEDARLSFAISFGSCSFDEPRADLRELGLL
ncbi:MAG: hypothetical protein HKO59_01200 [Phycisphaerales bacterium]|nr:hypothetical protein [Phycisphaerae bacterium]NNF41849.1 hypothetical protein [Phycisphaerales bacterium]NNM24596.1 hypothetical protein [Phycisphaerales bacterium]